MVSGTGHPLPESEEARHSEIPEELERRKGLGDEGKAAVQPDPRPVNPDGQPYPHAGGKGAFERDQQEHQDRGQSSIERDGDR